MERISSGFAVALLFCILGGILYLRSSAESPPAASGIVSGADGAHFAGQRHPSIALTDESNELNASKSLLHGLPTEGDSATTTGN